MRRSQRAARDLIKAISHETRLMILCHLAEGEKSVGELEALMNLRQPIVSQQLSRLRAEGVVTKRREGRAVYYKMSSREASKVIALLHDIFCK